MCIAELEGQVHKVRPQRPCGMLGRLGCTAYRKKPYGTHYDVPTSILARPKQQNTLNVKPFEVHWAGSLGSCF